MGGALNALGIILVVVVTVITLWRFGKRPAAFGRWAAGLLAFAFSALVPLVLSMHLCGAGAPIHQWAYCAPSLGAIIILVPRKALRRSLAALVFVAQVLLSVHFDSLAHTRSYTGNPDWEERTVNACNNANLRAVASMLQGTSAADQAVYPEGWLETSVLIDRVPQEFREYLTGHSSDTCWLWHTWLTGLYRMRVREDLRVWYPGGTVWEAVDRLEFRASP
jgi:hypothetical protein